MARGIPKARKGKGLLAWRSRQKRGSIMKASTFKDIEESMEGKVGEERAAKAAGAAYWKAARKKHRGRGK